MELNELPNTPWGAKKREKLRARVEKAVPSKKKTKKKVSKKSAD